MTARYDEATAGDYWGTTRFATGISEDEAVLGMNRPAGVNQAYSDWELSCVRRRLDALPAASTVLDVGAGVGRVSRELARHRSVIAVDRAAGMARRCRRNLAGLPADVVQGSALALPLRDASVHAVVCLGVLEHIPQPLEAAVLGECARVLRPGGLLLVEANNSGSVLLQDAGDNRHRTAAQWPNGYFCRLADPAAVRGALVGLGLTIEAVDCNPFYSLLRHTGWPDDPGVAGTMLRLDARAPWEAVGEHLADQVIFCARRPACPS